MKEIDKKDKFGQLTALIGSILYLGALVFFVLPLPSKIDTLLCLSWVFCPVIIGALVYAKIEGNGDWDQSKTLR